MWPVLRVVVVLLVVGCGNTDPPKPEFIDLGTPAPLPPHQPGYLELGPIGLQLRPGESTTLEANAFDSTGLAIAHGTITWATSNASIAIVSTSGVVNAIRGGVVEIAATDSLYGTWLLQISVMDAPTTGVTGIRFQPPVLQLVEGAVQPVIYTLRNASGGAATSTLKLVVDGDAVAISGTSITAVHTGVAIVTAIGADGMPLAGRLPVVVNPAHPSASNGLCDVEHVVGCSREFPPEAFSRPGGVDAPLAVWSCISPAHNCNIPVTPAVCRLAAPTRVEMAVLANTPVLEIGSDGLVKALRPGSTALREYVDDVACDGGTLLGVAVAPDMSGSWRATCSDGETGKYTVGDWPSTVYHWNHWHGATGGGNGVGLFFGSANGSCFVDRDMKLLCNVTSSQASGLGPHFGSYGYGPAVLRDPRDENVSWNVGACTPSSQCAANLSLSDCAGHNGGAQVVDADHIVIGKCELNRGDASCAPTGCDGDYTIIGSAHIGCESPPFTYDVNATVHVEDGMATVKMMGLTTTVPVTPDCMLQIPKDSDDGCPMISHVELTNGGMCQLQFDDTDLSTHHCVCTQAVPCTVTKGGP